MADDNPLRLRFTFFNQGNATLTISAEDALTLGINFDDDRVIAQALAVKLFNERVKL